MEDLSLMKVLNISRYLPIKGFPPINDITLRIYAGLKDQYGVESMFIMPLGHIPKWAGTIKSSLVSRNKIINNNNYTDKKYNIPIRFFQSYFPLLSQTGGYGQFNDLKLQFPFYKGGLYKHVKSFKPDLVHAHTIGDAFLAYKINKKFGIPYIVTLRGFYHKMYKNKIFVDVLNKAKKLITPSARLKQDLEGLYNVKLLPHGVEKEWYLEEEKKFDKNTLRIITVASLIEMKNIQVVIKSVARLVKEGYQIKYSIVGAGSYKEALKELVVKEKIEDFVTFYGFLSHTQIRKLYKSHDIFIMLSYPETFGRVYFEAAASGLLIIGRKDTGMDGYFDNDEAFSIEAEEDEVCKVLQQIDTLLFKKITAKSRQRIMAFENDLIIKQYYEILYSAALRTE